MNYPIPYSEWQRSREHPRKSSLQKEKVRAGEMVSPVSAAKSNDLSSIPRTHTLEGENHSTKLPSALHRHTEVCTRHPLRTYTHTHRHTHKVKNRGKAISKNVKCICLPSRFSFPLSNSETHPEPRIISSISSELYMKSYRHNAQPHCWTSILFPNHYSYSPTFLTGVISTALKTLSPQSWQRLQQQLKSFTSQSSFLFPQICHHCDQISCSLYWDSLGGDWQPGTKELQGCRKHGA